MCLSVFCISSLGQVLAHESFRDGLIVWMNECMNEQMNEAMMHPVATRYPGMLLELCWGRPRSPCLCLSKKQAGNTPSPTPLRIGQADSTKVCVSF